MAWNGRLSPTNDYTYRLTKLGVERLIGIAKFALPPRCLQCGQALPIDVAFCNGCLDDLPRNESCCARCAAVISVGELCGDCLASPPPFDFAFSPLRYQFPVDYLVGQFKYEDQPAIARLLGSFLGAELLATRSVPLPGALIPVPLHPSRLRERGYNQALEVCRSLSKVTGIPVARNLLTRTRPTNSQVGRRREDRDRNVRAAFATSGIPGHDHYAIVDDVITSGATMREISATLRKAGVHTIEAWSLARA